MKKKLKTFFLLSDSHVGNAAIGMEDFKVALKNMKEIDKSANLIHLGDLTNYGDALYLDSMLSDIYSDFANPMILLGNHDVRGKKNGLSEVIDADGWLDFWKVYWDVDKDSLEDSRCNAFQQTKNIMNHFQKESSTNTLYQEYDYENSIVFALCTEKPLKDSCYLSNEQLKALDKAATKAKDHSKLLLVLSHQALNHTHPGSDEYRGFGPQNDLLEKILSRYQNILFLSGHIHNGLGNTMIIKKKYGSLVDIPSFCYPDNGLMEKSIGYYVEIQENSVQFTPYYLGSIQNNEYKKLEAYTQEIYF